MKSVLVVCGSLLLSCGPAGEIGGNREQPITRIAFGSCAMQWLEQPIWDVVIEQEPDLFLFLGDAIYGDWDGEKVVPATPASLRRDWDKLATIPGFTRLRESIPVLATWDNHDYGTHNGGAEFALKDTSRAIFLDFFEEPESSERRQHPGIYDARLHGPEGKRLQIILLDTRSFKGPFVKDERPAEEKKRLNIVGKYAPNADPDVTLLGDDQWRWLESQLEKPADLRLIASSTQVIPDEKGMDEWGNYPHERESLLKLLSNAGPVLLLTGNVHFAEVSAVDMDAGMIVEFTSSGLTHIDERYARAVNSYRVAGPLADPNFGRVEIDWEGGVLSCTAIDSSGVAGFEYQMRFQSSHP